jgi:hypothetical protein
MNNGMDLMPALFLGAAAQMLQLDHSVCGLVARVGTAAGTIAQQRSVVSVNSMEFRFQSPLRIGTQSLDLRLQRATQVGKRDGHEVGAGTRSDKTSADSFALVLVGSAFAKHRVATAIGDVVGNGNTTRCIDEPALEQVLLDHTSSAHDDASE